MGSFGNVEIENRVNVKINSKREEENKVCFGRKEERRNALTIRSRRKIY